MKIKKFIFRTFLCVLFVSFLVLAIVLFTGCESRESLDLTHYTLDLSFDENTKIVDGQEIVEYKNQTSNSLSFVMFHLYPNAFREGAKISPVSLTNEHKAYPNGKSYGNIKIENVKLSGMECSLKLGEEDEISSPSYQIAGEDENILKINLTKELFPNEEIQIEIKFKVTVPNIHHRFGYGDSTINLGNIYPIACAIDNGEFKTDLYHYNGDPFYSEMANYDVNFKFPEKFTCVCSGEIIKETTNNGSKNLQVCAKNVRDFAIILSEKYNVISAETDSTKINYYYYNDSEPEASLEVAKQAISTFNKLIGKYSYKTFNVAEANFVHGGMEYPNLVLISDDIKEHKQYEQVIVHETAHQWWYNLVGNSEYDNAWLDEGLTEYTTALFYELNPSYEIKREDLIKNAYSNYQLFVEVYEGAFGEVDTSINRKLNEYSSEQEYVYMAYVKGMLLFDNIREIIGLNKFKKCLKIYFEENKYKIAKPETLISAFEKGSSMKLENIFNAWINGKIIILK